MNALTFLTRNMVSFFILLHSDKSKAHSWILCFCFWRFFLPLSSWWLVGNGQRLHVSGDFCFVFLVWRPSGTCWLMACVSIGIFVSSVSFNHLFSLQGDHTWATMLGQSVRLQPVPIQSLSELERARLQEVALYHLEERDLDFKISIPKGKGEGQRWCF